MAEYDGSIKFDTKIDTASFQDSLKKLELMSAAAFGAISAAAAGAIKECISAGASFESAMSSVGAISGATSSELDALKKKAQEMGASTVFSASQSAQAFTYMAMSGWKTADMLDGIEGIMALAAASGADLATTSDIVTDALTAFGLSASDAGHFSDVLAAASSNANTNVTMMGETFKYVAPMAGSLGYSVEDISTAIGLMANSSIKASMAGTSLNAIISRLATNTSGARDAVESLGVSFYDAQGNARPFGKVMEELRDATKGMNDEQKTALANNIAGVEASKGFLSILNATTDDYNKLSDAINHADGAAKKMSDTMVDNLQGDMTLLQSALEGLEIAAYDCIEEPFRKAASAAADALGKLTESARGGELKSSLQKLGDSTGELLEKLSELAIKALPKLVDAFSFLIEHGRTLAIVFGTVALAANGWKIGALINHILSLASAESGLVGVQTALNAAMAANPAGAMIVILTTLIGVLSLVNSEMNISANAVSKVQEKINSLNRSVSDSKKQAEAHAAQVRTLTDRLIELTDELDDTTVSAEQAAIKEQEYYNIGDKLKELAPDLASAIFDENDAYRDQSKAIKELTDNYLDYYYTKSVAEAYYSKVGEAAILRDEAKRAYEQAQKKSDDFIPATYENMHPDRTKWYQKLADLPTMVLDSGLYVSDALCAEKLSNKAQNAKEDWQAAEKNLEETLKQYEEAEKAFSYMSLEWKSKIQSKTNVSGESNANGSGNEGNVNGNGSGGTSKSTSTTTAASAADKFRGLYRELQYLRDRDKLSEKEYYDCLDKLKDEYFKEGTQDWQTYELEVYNGRKKLAENSAEKELETLRKSLSDGEISEKEYYEKLAEYRDRYLSETSDEWESATQSIIGYEKRVISSFYQDILDTAEEKIGSVRKKIDAMAQKLKSYGSLTKKDEQGNITAASQRETLTALRMYELNLTWVKDRMKRLGFEEGDIKAFFSAMADMSVDEGSAFAESMLHKTDAAFKGYIDEFKERQALSDKIADALYSDEQTKAADETVQYIKDEFEKLGKELPDTFFDSGRASAKSFGEAFGKEFERQMQSLTDSINKFKFEMTLGANISGISIKTENPAPAVTNVTNNVYIEAKKGSSAYEEVQEAKKALEKKDMRGM